MVDRKEDQSTQFRDTSSGNFEQAKNIATQTEVDPSLADAQTVAQSLGVDLNTGLSQAEAKRRLDKYGPNELSSAPPVPKWKKFLEQFKDPLVYLLLAATGISLVAWFIERANAVPGAEGGEALPFDAIVIVLILIVNAVLGYIQESKAEAAVEALSSMTAPQTNVLRDGKIERINTVDVVPGDIIVLGEGDSVSADGRLFTAASLRVAEASLTGESVPVGKKTDTLAQAKALGDRANMVFNGTSVTQGTGRAIVTSTGMGTQVGKIADLLQATEDDETPLQKEMNYVSKILGSAVCIIAVVVLVALALTEGFQDVHDVIDSLLLAVSLAVAAVPEGLAAILTVVLALGVQRMAMHNAIVKKLHSVETLGSASVICSDKTGTLTQNRMTVEQVLVDGRVLQPGQLRLYDPVQRYFLYGAVLDNDAVVQGETCTGDPTEAALLAMALRADVSPEALRREMPRLGELPFDSGRKRMSTLHWCDGICVLFTKGAPDVLLERTDQILTKSGVRPMTPEQKKQIRQQNESWAAGGLRVLAVAYRPLEQMQACSLELEDSCIFLGIAAMLDPPRPESKPAVLTAKKAGIRPVMITGDHPVTALAVAEKTGILEAGDLAVTGPGLDQMTDGELDRKLEYISVYARVSPEHKIRIVEAWQRQGRIVAMTGDGVNDAPALKKADIGVAMGIMGTEVSKDAASMILTDDNFATMIKAVANGRNVYRNIRNAVQFLLSGNMAGIL